MRREISKPIFGSICQSNVNVLLKKVHFTLRLSVTRRFSVRHAEKEAAALSATAPFLCIKT